MWAEQSCSMACRAQVQLPAPERESWSPGGPPSSAQAGDSQEGAGGDTSHSCWTSPLFGLGIALTQTNNCSECCQLGRDLFCAAAWGQGCSALPGRGCVFGSGWGGLGRQRETEFYCEGQLVEHFAKWLQRPQGRAGCTRQGCVSTQGLSQSYGGHSPAGAVPLSLLQGGRHDRRKVRIEPLRDGTINGLAISSCTFLCLISVNSRKKSAWLSSWVSSHGDSCQCCTSSIRCANC